MNKTLESGSLKVLASYAMWGILPLFWKALKHVDARLVLAHRICWALLFTSLLLLLLRQGGATWRALRTPARLGSLLGASLLISCNWWLYIWAVGHGRILESAFGYYINPLMSVLLGMAFHRERLTRAQAWTFALALMGVMIMGLGMGSFPWVALGLATTFALYGFLKKQAATPALNGLQAETLLSLPLALAFLLPAAQTTHSLWGLASLDLRTVSLLAAAGPLTVVPLWLFASGARKVTMTQLGFYQYLSPTLGFLIGLLIFHEPLNPLRLVAFSFIWVALGVFLAAEWRKTRLEPGQAS